MTIPFSLPSLLAEQVGLPTAPALLVAFSGGADSRLLLELTVRYARTVGMPVTAAHLHHGIRGAEADRDEAFCRACADRLGIGYVSSRVDVPARAALSGRSLEWEARLARYEFFGQVMSERHIPVLLTAHHADDQLETLLSRLMRGSGTHGLGGIPPVRRITGGVLLRPLLEATKADILAACQDMRLDFVTDSTNLCDDCTRNRLRHGVIPRLEAIYGAGVPQRTAARLCRTAREDEDCLTELAMSHRTAVCDREDGTLSLTALSALPPALAKRLLADGYRCRVLTDMCDQPMTPADGPPAAMPIREKDGLLSADRTLNAAHLEALLALVRTGREGSETHLPAAWRGIVRQGRLVFQPPTQAATYTTDPPPTGHPGPSPRPLTVGQTFWPGEYPDTVILWEESDVPLLPSVGDGIMASAVFPAGLPRPLWARQRQPGDAVLSHGMTKKLKKVLCDRHIPPALRDALPLICLPDASGGPGEPLWFPTAIYRDGWPAPVSGPCLRLTVLVSRANA